jgi:ABC-2 type transport system permease protein
VDADGEGTLMTVTTTATVPVIEVREAGGTFGEDVRATAMVWRREIIRFKRNRTRMITTPVQPLLFLLVLGTGLASFAGRNRSVDFKTFMFPGVIAMSVLFTAIFSAVSIVWDREFGFMREMLVAPIHRSSLVMGKCLGGATVATFQGCFMLLLAGLAHVPYSPSLFVVLIGEMALLAFTLTALGTMVASRMTQVESFQVVMQLFVLPLFFLSGAMFPLTGLPPWLMVMTKIDPLSYAVDPMRRAVFAHLPHAQSVAAHHLNPGMTWNGHLVPTGVELLIVALLGLAMTGMAMFQFNRPE